MEHGVDKLLPVIATFLQFSPEEVQRIKDAREKFAAGGGAGGAGLFGGTLGEDWLFGADGPTPKRKGLRPARSAEEAAGGAWKELEQSWRKIKGLKQLLAASNRHLEAYQAEFERAKLMPPAPAAEGAPPAPSAAELSAIPMGRSNSLASKDVPLPMSATGASQQMGEVGEVGEAEEGWATFGEGASEAEAFGDASWGAQPAAPDASPRKPPVAAASPPLVSRRAPPSKVPLPTEPLSEAEVEAERALLGELEADNDARRQLDAATKAREPAALKAALELMADRGLDCDDETIDSARLLLAELEKSSAKPKAKGRR